MKRPSRLLPSLTVAALAAGTCGCDTGASAPDAGPPPSCLEAPNHSDLEWIQAEIFDRSCAAFSSCHMGTAASAGGLNLEEGMAEANLVDVESALVNDLGMGPMDLVEPGSSADSYLVVILSGEPESLIDPDVGTMPYATPRLCDAKIDAIRRWIDSL